MVYLTHYEKYPIYEPAEGGYYYEGIELTFSTQLSLRQAKRDLKNMAEELLEDGYKPVKAWQPHTYNELPGFKWTRSGEYIGEGDFWVIERKQGSFEKGYEPYC